LAEAVLMHSSGRLDRIDLLRAVAMLWMTAYHFSFDLDHFGLISADFRHDPFWTCQRTAIVSLFLFTAGLSQAVALDRHQDNATFWRRWVQVAGAALLVTVGSLIMFPRSFIAFGVLHGIAVMLLVVRATGRWGAWWWPLGATLMFAPLLAPPAMAAWPALELFNRPAFRWLGFINRLPATEDFVPLLPWLGVMGWGMAAGQWALRNRPAWLGVNDAPATGVKRGLVWLGCQSLSYYLLHQPVMIALLGAAVWLQSR
jgi:uncharacterized membrane protein